MLHGSVAVYWALLTRTLVTLDQGPLTDPHFTVVTSLTASFPHGDTMKNWGQDSNV